MVARLLLAVLVASFAGGAHAQARVVPDPHTDAAFLQGHFKPGRPTVVVFKDPFCPYCIRAIPHLEKLGYYNVYVFWSPILGARSEERVTEILRCTNVASEPVMRAVAERRTPGCTGAAPAAVVARNREVVNSYGIKAVPSYYMGGQSTSLAALVRASDGLVRTVNGVSVDWDRYALMRRAEPGPAETQAVIVLGRSERELEAVIEELAPQYVFGDGPAGAAWLERRCAAGAEPLCENRDSYERRVAEFLMLLGLEQERDAVYVIARDGSLSRFGRSVSS